MEPIHFGHFGHFGTYFYHKDPKSKKWAISNTSNGLWYLKAHLYWVYMVLQVFWLNILLTIADILILDPLRPRFWRHYAVITSKKSIFETKKIFHCVTRWHSYMIGCDFNLHYIIYRKLFIDKDNLYLKNEEKWQKWRHYDVINMWKFPFTKK